MRRARRRRGRRYGAAIGERARRGGQKGGRQGGHVRRQSAESRESLLTDLARSLVEEAAILENALEAEQWASHVEGTWRSRSALEAEAATAFAVDLVGALERRGGDPAHAALRAIATVCSQPAGALAGAAAARLAARGAAEPAWAAGLGAATPAAAKLMRDDVFDDGVNVLVEFEHPDAVHVLGVYIDHNLGVMAKDAFLGGTLAEIVEIAAEHGSEPVSLEPLALDEAAARIAAAVELTDMTLDPPVGADFWSLRALIDARMRVLPEAGEAPGRPELSIEDREALVQAFRASEEGERFAGDQDALDVVSLAIDFCADYVDGRPLRWSPVVVELFMADWLPRKVLAGRSLFERVPEVLPAWIGHAGRVRGIPAGAIEATAAAVGDSTESMFAAIVGEGSFAPAKRLMAAATGAGVDPSDPSELDPFLSDRDAGHAAP